MPVRNLPASSASMVLCASLPTRHSRAGCTTAPLALPCRFHTLPPTNVSLHPLHLWEALSRNDRQGMLPPSQHPAFVWEQRALMAALPFLSQPEEPEGPPSDPAREAGIPTGREDRAAGISLFVFETQVLLSGCLCVCPMGRTDRAGALRLGPVFVSLAHQQRAVLVGFPSKHQTDPHPFELSQSAKKTVWTLKFLLLFSAFLTLPLPPTAGPSCQGKCPPGTTQGNGGGEVSPPEILFGETRMSGPGQAARSRQGSWMSLPWSSTSGVPGAGRGRAGAAALVTGRAPGAVPAPWQQRARHPLRAGARPWIRSAPIAPAGNPHSCLFLWRDAFIEFPFAVSSPYPALMWRVSSGILWCLHCHGSLGEALGGPAQHTVWEGAGFEGLLLHEPYPAWASMAPVTEIIKL